MADVLPSDELIDEPSDYGALKPGDKLGRYELLVPIARGGMARVWAARLHGQRGFQKLVALKTILPHLADEPEFERMFLDEARIASGVHHPNVCEIYELGEEKRTLYLAMEWVSGDSLARVLRASGKTEALEPRVVARIVADACAGLHAAHELTDDDGRSLGVVHRDLSPHNILLTADGTAKVADFGVAKALGQLHEATSAGQLKGKIAYMAPEQVTGNQIDRRSDVFSLGCVLYEATTGQRPFRGDGDHQVMHAVLKGEYPPPASLVRGYPQELERIVARALSQQPILRYPTAERMRFALEEFVARGQLVTQSNVAQVVRARLGELLDRRKERIRQASTAGDREGGWSEPPGGMTPSNQAHDAHRSGVKQSGAHAARPLYTTMAMDRPPLSMAPLTPQMDQPASSTTIPQAAQHPFAATMQSVGGEQGERRGHTPVSHPGAAYSPGGRSQAGPPAPVPKPLAQTALMPPLVNLPPGALDLPGPATVQMPPVNPPLPAPVPQYPMLPQMQQTPPPPVVAQSPFGPNTVPPNSGGVSSGIPSGIPSGFDHAPYGYPSGDGRGSTPPAGAGQYLVAIGVGVLLAALIGIGGYFAWRGRHHAATEVAPIAVRSAGPVVPVPVPLPMAPSGAADPAGSSAPAPVSAEIVFRVVPSEAALSVDGKELAADVRTVPRPPVGKTVNVVAHAPGHEDTTVLVDFFTTSPMELALKPVAAEATTAKTDTPPTPPPVSTGANGEATGETPAPAKDPAKKKPQGGSSGLPANPY